MGWVGCRPPPDGQTHRARPSLRRVIGLDDSQLSGHKAYRTADGPRTPQRHTREGDAAVPVCVWARALVWGGGVHAWLSARQAGRGGEGSIGCCGLGQLKALTQFAIEARGACPRSTITCLRTCLCIASLMPSPLPCCPQGALQSTRLTYHEHRSTPAPPCNSYALVIATVGVGTVLIWYLILIRYKCSAAA